MSDAAIRAAARDFDDLIPEARVARTEGRFRAGVVLLARLGDASALDMLPEPGAPIPRDVGRLAASLGHPLARRVYPDAEPVDWAAWLQRQGAIETAGSHGVCVVSLACDYAEHVLPLWESHYPGDARPRQAIEAARAWVANPCEETRRAVANAAAANAAANAAAAAYTAAANAAAAAFFAKNSAAEREWQRLHLAQELLRER